MIQKLKQAKVMKPIRAVYKRIRYGELSRFAKPKYFLNNSKFSSTLCLVLAGYKEFTWEIVFKRIKKFCPDDIDVCIVSSGLYSEKLNEIAKENKWSYISMKRNCVTLALNSSVQSFPNARKIFKIDEDIFITEGFFESLPLALENSKKNYFPCFSAPLIPVNGYGYRRILERLNLSEKYAELFEFPKISAGSFMQIESNPEVAKFFWNRDNFVPQIDDLNRKIKLGMIEGEYSVCPIRFSIGAIYFEKSVLEKEDTFQ